MSLRPAFKRSLLLVIALACACSGVVSDSPVANPITLEELRNAAYPSKFTMSGRATLHDGEYHEREGVGVSDEIVVTMTPLVARGELAARPVAAVVLRTTAGGTGTFYDLVLIGNEGSSVRVLASAVLGDRVDVESIALLGDGIEVRMVAHGPDDPMCCPTERVTRIYRPAGDLLVSTP